MWRLSNGPAGLTSLSSQVQVPGPGLDFDFVHFELGGVLLAHGQHNEQLPSIDSNSTVLHREAKEWVKDEWMTLFGDNKAEKRRGSTKKITTCNQKRSRLRAMAFLCLSCTQVEIILDNPEHLSLGKNELHWHWRKDVAERECLECVAQNRDVVAVQNSYKRPCYLRLLLWRCYARLRRLFGLKLSKRTTWRHDRESN